MKGTCVALQILLICPVFGTAACCDDHFNYTRLTRGQSLMSPPSNNLLHQHVLGLAFKLYHIVDVDDQRQTVSLKARVIFDWIDRRLAWQNAADSPFQSITVDQVTDTHMQKLWQPRVKIQQALGPPVYFTPRYLQVTSDGHVYDYSYVIITSSCRISTKKFPFDVQRCELLFACTTCLGTRVSNRTRYLGFEPQNLSAFLDTSYSDISGKNNKFQLLDLQVQIAEITPTRRERKPVLIVVMKRKVAYYVFYLFVPSLMITASAFVQFLLPVQGGEKITIGVTCLLSEMVFLLLLQEIVAPDQQDEIPLLGRLFGGQAATIMLITAMSALVVRLHYKAYNKENRPSTFLLLITRVFATLMCNEKVKREIDEAFVLCSEDRRHHTDRHRTSCEHSTHADVNSDSSIYFIKTLPSGGGRSRGTVIELWRQDVTRRQRLHAKRRASQHQDDGLRNNCNECFVPGHPGRNMGTSISELYVTIADVFNAIFFLISFISLSAFMLIEIVTT